MGLVIQVDGPSEAVEELVSHLLTEHTLSQATGRAARPPLDLDALRQYLDVVGRRSVAVSPAANQLLQAFYQASRRVRTSSIYCTDMPVTARDTM